MVVPAASKRPAGPNQEAVSLAAVGDDATASPTARYAWGEPSAS